jgi:signal transduction histidine kinase/DNA-binding response OmpR family regulator/ligand-binding sensor domain-containing protein
VLSLLFFVDIYAKNDWNIEMLTPKDGLSFRHVTEVFQDSNDFIWFGTRNGLNRYDGNAWQVFKYQDHDSTSISHNNIFWIAEDDDNNLLIGTEGGINFYDVKSNTFKLAALQGKNRNSDILATKPLKDEHGNTYSLSWSVIDEEISLLKYMGQGKFEILRSLSKVKLIEDFGRLNPLWSNSNVLWYYDRVAYYKVSVNETTIEKIPYSKFGKHLVNTNGNFIPVDKGGNFHIPSTDPNNFKYVNIDELTGKSIASWFFDSKNRLWIADRKGNLFVHDEKKSTFQKVVQLDFPDIPSKLFIDKQNNCWIPSVEGVVKIKALNRYFDNYLKDFAAPDSQKEQLAPYTMLEDDNGHLIFIDGYSIYHMSISENEQGISTGEIIKKSSDLKEWTIKLIQDEEGILWYPQKKNLISYNPNSGNYYQYEAPGEIAALEFDENGNIWLSENPGGRCFIFDPDDREFEIIDIPGFPYLTSTMLQDGPYLWVSTQNGLLRITTDNREFQHFEILTNRNFYREWIYGICKKDNAFWLATGEGLWKYVPEKNILTKYTTKNGIPHDIIYTILNDGDHLWLGTHNGLCKFDIETKSVHNFFDIDGLTHNEFNRAAALKSSSGRMYFGGMNGINAFYPQELHKNEERIASKLVWTAFSKGSLSAKEPLSYQFNQLNESQTLQLSHKDNNLSFSFALLNYIDPEQNLYDITLDGEEFQWSKKTKDPTINFQYLPPGTHRLNVIAYDLFGTPSANILSIPIEIKGPWYMAWYNFVFIFLGMVLLGFGIRRYEMKLQFNRTEAENLKKIGEAKERFYSNITHEFRTPLTIIQGMTQEIQGHVKAKEIIHRNTDTLIRLINQMLHMSKVESGLFKLKLQNSDLLPYLKFLSESFEHMAKSLDLDLVIYAEVDQLNMDYDEEVVQLIFSNIISNAIKFSEPGGRIMIHIHYSYANSEDWVDIKIRDNGRGIDESDHEKIFERFYQVPVPEGQMQGTGIGLSLTKELVSLLGGDIFVKSKKGEGSEFIIRLPIRNNVEPDEAVNPSLRKFENKKMRSVTSDKHELTGNTNYEQFNNKPILLIIEDNRDVVYYLESILKEDYTVYSAKDGENGVKLAKEIVPDIVICDVMMPKMDGFEVCNILKNDPSTNHIPLILLTARADQKDRLKGLSVGADAYINKPMDKEELFLSLKKLIELRKQLQISYQPSNDLDTDSKENKEMEFLMKLNLLIEEKLFDSDMSIELIARELGLSRSQLFRKLKALTNLSATSYIRNYRLKRAKNLLSDTDKTISEIAFEVGFADLSYFSTRFKELYGITPSEFKNKTM